MVSIPARRRVFVLFIVLIGACHSTDEVVPTGTSTEAMVLTRTVDAARLAPLVAGAGEILLRVWPVALDCPATFDLGDGLTGTCGAWDPGGYGYYFRTQHDVRVEIAATASLPGGSDPPNLAFQLIVESLGDGFDFELQTSRADANLPSGHRYWHTAGTVETDGAGSLERFGLDVTVSGSMWLLRPGSIVLPARPRWLGEVQVDLASGTGTIRSEGRVVANLSMTDHCVSIDFIDPAKADEETCPW